MATLGDVLPIALPLIVGIALVALAALVARSGLHLLHNRFYSSLYFLSGVKSMSEGLIVEFNGRAIAERFNATSPLFPDAEAWVRVSETCGLAMLPLIFLFVMSFPSPRPWLTRNPWLGVLAFLPSAALAGLLFATPMAARADPADPRSALVFDYGGVGFSLLGTGITVLALLVLVRANRQAPDRIQRQQAGYVIAGLLPSFVATWVLTYLITGYRVGSVEPQLLVDGVHVIGQYLSPTFELLGAGAVGFAITKYNILGVAPRFRVGVKSFLAGFVFVVVFLVTQFVENVVLQGQLFSFAGDYGSFMLSGIAGIVLFKPIDKVSSKVSDRLLPRQDDAAARAAEVYRAQCTYILGDATVTDREMAFLRNLRDQLGLSEAQARAIEESVERLLKVDAPQTGASAGTARPFIATAAREVAAAPFEVLSPSRPPAAKGGNVAVRAAPARPASTAPAQAPARAREPARATVAAVRAPPGKAPGPGRPAKAASKAAPGAAKPARKPAAGKAAKGKSAKR